MKKITLLLLAMAMVCTGAMAQKNVKWVDAQSLTHLGKLCQTTNPYHRVEVANYPEFNSTESRLLRKSAGESIIFETNSVMGVGLPSEYWLRDWVDAVKNTEIPD